MQVAKRQSNLGCIKLGPRFFKPAFFAKMLEQLSTLDESHNKVNSRRLGENMLHRYNKGVRNLE